jgi:hypothetical protein
MCMKWTYIEPTMSENRMTDLDEIWYGRYAIGVHP